MTNELKKRGTPCATKEDVEKFILEMAPGRYEVVEYRPGSTAKVVFRDIQRNVIFEKKINAFKTEIRENPTRIFHPNKEEKRAIIMAAYKEKYGVEVSSPFALKEVRDKANAKIKEIYGVDNVFKNDQIKDKIKATNVERYGVENVLMRPEIHEKAIKLAHSDAANEKRLETFMRDHGGTNSFTSPDIKKKIDDIKIEKYGSTHAINDEILEKRKKTMVERYGAEYPMQSEQIRAKIRETNLEKYGGISPASKFEVVQKAIQTKIEKGILKLYGGKNLKELAAESDASYTYFQQMAKKHGVEFAINYQKQYTDIEILMTNILDGLNLKYEKQKHFKKFIADFCIEDKKLVIETDGLFWHSDAVIKNRNYHKQKKEFYKSHGYDSLFFRSDELEKDPQVVKSIIQNKVGANERIFARKCLIQELNKEVSDEFFSKNHLMGPGAGRTFALRFEHSVENEPVVVAIQVKWKNKLDKIVEISRFCTKNGISVVGGYSRLMTHVKKELSPDRIISFVDERYGSGEYLSSLGWQKIGSYLSFKWTDGKVSFHRMNFPNNDGKIKNLAKIWDCGQAKWQLDLNK